LRALAVHEDLIVVVSGIWQTTCTIVRSGGEGFLIDSPILPEELSALPDLLEQTEFPLSGLLCTHADWDHLLGRLAFPQATLGAGEPSCRRLAEEPQLAQRELRAFDDTHYVSRSPLELGDVEPLPVPGRLALGEANELELHPTPGHTADGTAFFVPWLQVLICGDYISPVEIPMIEPSGSAEAYAATLQRLAPLVDASQTIVPGHGKPLTHLEAYALLREDLSYLEALLAYGAETPLPASRNTAAQRLIHAANAERLT
jgi:glyoxylase-like metal-dependent hydrolase (beta-lactamase superfamily II)